MWSNLSGFNFKEENKVPLHELPDLIAVSFVIVYTFLDHATTGKPE